MMDVITFGQSWIFVQKGSITPLDRALGNINIWKCINLGSMINRGNDEVLNTC